MQNGETNLSHLSSVRTGYTFREKITETASGTVTVIQPKDISEREFPHKGTSVKESEINSLKKHLLTNGDILIVNKGLRFSVCLYAGIPTNCIASSSFYIITPNQQIILPAYLLWYLEQEPTKNYLQRRASGAVIPGINKADIEQLPIHLPTLKTQRYIVELLSASQQELTILQQLYQLKKEFYNSHIWEKLSNI